MKHLTNKLPTGEFLLFLDKNIWAFHTAVTSAGRAGAGLALEACTGFL